MKTAVRLRNRIEVAPIFTVRKVRISFCIFRRKLAVTVSRLPESIVFADQRCAELQSDLEDFDLVDSDTSDGDPKSHVLPDDEEANSNTDPQNGQRLSAECPKLTPVNHQKGSFYMNPDLRSPDAKPKIWSIAHTAVPPEAGSSPEYPPCMLSSTRSSSPVYPTNMALTSVDRQQESPVATLRDWVDGVFHGPPFQQPKPAEAWKDLNKAMIDSGTCSQSFELIQSTPCL